MKNWIPIDEFMRITKITKNQIYQKTKSKQWRNGYVIKRSPCPHAKNQKMRREGKLIRWGCIEDYHQWEGI